MKKNPNTSTIIAVLALVVILVGASNALAEDIICNDTFIGGTVNNVIAEDGCEMLGTIVTGNVWVEEEATVWFGGITVHGNFQTDGAYRVILTKWCYAQDDCLYSKVYGDVQMKNLLYNSGVYETYVGGNLQVEENEWLSIYRNFVEGNLQAYKNTGGMYIDSCTIGGNLQCFDNDPPPFWWCDRNTVSGSKEGQCSNLQYQDWPTGICWK